MGRECFRMVLMISGVISKPLSYMKVFADFKHSYFVVVMGAGVRVE